MHGVTRDAILRTLASWKPFLRALASYELNLFSCKLKPISLQMWAKLYYKTNKKAKTVLCSVIKHARKWLEHSSSREKHSPAARAHPTLLLVTSLRALSQNKARFWLFYLLIISHRYQLLLATIIISKSGSNVEATQTKLHTFRHSTSVSPSALERFTKMMFQSHFTCLCLRVIALR